LAVSIHAIPLTTLPQHPAFSTTLSSQPLLNVAVNKSYLLIAGHRTVRNNDWFLHGSCQTKSGTRNMTAIADGMIWFEWRRGSEIEWTYVAALYSLELEAGLRKRVSVGAILADPTIGGGIFAVSTAPVEAVAHIVVAPTTFVVVVVAPKLHAAAVAVPVVAPMCLVAVPEELQPLVAAGGWTLLVCRRS
jgi:hypothetical protein